MNNKTIIFILAMMCLVALAPFVSGNSWCFQEFANVSTECGGLATGSYIILTLEPYPDGAIGSPNNAIDGSWDTSFGSWNGVFYINITYFKPTGATNNSLWMIKDDYITEGWGITEFPANVSIPSACWNFNESYLEFGLYQPTGDVGSYLWKCRNSTGMKTLYRGQQETFWEEAMIWDMEPAPEPSPSPSPSPPTPVTTFTTPNLTSLDSLFLSPNETTGGTFWTGIYWMIVAVIFLSAVSFGWEIAFAMSFFGGLIIGIFFLYLGWIQMFVFSMTEASLLVVLIYLIYSSRSNP